MTTENLDRYCKVAALDATQLGIAFGINKDVFCKYLSDGRTSHRLIEHYAGDLFDFQVNESGSVKGGDGKYGAFGTTESVEVKTLTTKVCLQPSKNQGAGRCKTTEDEYVTVLQQFDNFFVGDISHPPLFPIFRLKSAWLINEYRNGNLSVNGWSRNAFYSFIRRKFSIQNPPLVYIPAADGNGLKRYIDPHVVRGYDRWWRMVQEGTSRQGKTRQRRLVAN